MKREFRITKSAVIKNIIATSKKISESTILGFHCPNESFKFAIVVSKKVSKRAVDRNLIKRQIRSMLHFLLPSLPAINLVIIVKSSYMNQNYEQNFKIMKGLLKKTT